MAIPISSNILAGGSGFAATDITQVKGATQIVSDDTARLDILASRREIGMTCHVLMTGQTYRLVGGIENTDWVESGPVQSGSDDPPTHNPGISAALYTLPNAAKVWLWNSTSWIQIIGCIVAMLLCETQAQPFLRSPMTTNSAASVHRQHLGLDAAAPGALGTNLLTQSGTAVPLFLGGTGATSAAGARAALELANNLDASLYRGPVTALAQALGTPGTNGAWYASGVAGTLTDPDPDIADVEIGDVILDDGSEWKRFPAVQPVTTLSDAMRVNAFDEELISSYIETNTVGSSFGTLSTSRLNTSGYGSNFRTNGLGEFNAVRLPLILQNTNRTSAATNITLVIGELVDNGTTDYVTNATLVHSLYSDSHTNGTFIFTLPTTIVPATYCTNGANLFVGWKAYSVAFTTTGDNMNRPISSVVSTNYEGNSWYSTYWNPSATNAWEDYSGDLYIPFQFLYIASTEPSTNFFLKSGHLPEEITNELHAATASLESLSGLVGSMTASTPLAMPPTVWGVEGREMHVYFAGLYPGDWRDMVWDATATGSAGTNYVEDWRDTPTTNWTRALSVAQYPKLATNWIARSSATNVIEAALSSDTGTNVLLAIGDSTTDGSAWLTPMAAIDAADANMVVTSIGTQTDGGINHEGRSGWTTALFVGETSPFWDGAGFSTEHYLTNNALVTPTHVVIKLGINDLFSDTTDSSADSTITSVMSRFATMVNNITNYVSGVKVGICLVEPCSRDQDAWGANYLSGQLGFRARRNYWKMNLSLIAAYGGRTAEGLYVIPTNVCIDDYWGYARATVAVNSREATTITRMSNGVHPGTSGNAQIADCIWAWLKNNP